MAEVRIAARLREKPRAYLIAAAVDNPIAAVALTSGWGYRCLAADVGLRRFYDRVTGFVRAGGRTVLEVTLFDPEPISGATLLYGPLANAAATGVDQPQVVLVDSELKFCDERERGRPQVSVLDAKWWSAEGLAATLPIGAFYATVDLSLPLPGVALDPTVPSGGAPTSLR
jgi:hypothetical protein